MKPNLEGYRSAGALVGLAGGAAIFYGAYGAEEGLAPELKLGMLAFLGLSAVALVSGLVLAMVGRRGILVFVFGEMLGLFIASLGLVASRMV
ncbi:MAG: hypothetical protein AAF908_08360 [Pseudomonadota bacterium]